MNCLSRFKCADIQGETALYQLYQICKDKAPVSVLKLPLPTQVSQQQRVYPSPLAPREIDRNRNRL